MAALYTHTTRSTGTVLTATIYNIDHQNHIDNGVPSQFDDYSSDTAQMQSVTDPGEAGAESLATSLAGELERLRFAIREAKTSLGLTSAQWYSTATGTVAITKGGTGGETAAAARTNLGATATGDALFTAASAAAARTTLGASAVGDAVFVAASQTAAREAQGIVVKRKTADESVVSSTTLQDDDHLTFAIGANEEWVVNFELSVAQSVNTTGLGVAVAVPAGSTVNNTATGIGSGPGETLQRENQVAGLALLFGKLDFSTSINMTARVSAWVLNGATPGNITLQFAQANSDAAAVTLRKGSHMIAHRIA